MKLLYGRYTFFLCLILTRELSCQLLIALGGKRKEPIIISLIAFACASTIMGAFGINDQLGVTARAVHRLYRSQALNGIYHLVKEAMKGTDGKIAQPVRETPRRVIIPKC